MCCIETNLETTSSIDDRRICFRLVKLCNERPHEIAILDTSYELSLNKRFYYNEEIDILHSGPLVVLYHPPQLHHYYTQIDGLEQDYSNSSVLAMELL